MDDDLKEVLSNIRAVITSAKGLLSVRDLTRDYESVVGAQIPYRKYEHTSVESFLNSLPSLRVSGTGRDATVEAASSQQSQHMSSLIAFQKSKRSRSVPPRRGNFNSRPYRGTRGHFVPRFYAPNHYRPSFSTRGQYPPTSYGPPRFHTPKNEENIPPYSTSATSVSTRFPKHKNEENEPLVIRLEGNKQRQVSTVSSSHPLVNKPSITDTRPKKYEVPPRLRKPRLGSSTQIVPDSFEVNNSSQLDTQGKTDSACTNDPIICPFRPGQLVAAGRANLQKESSIDFTDFNLLSTAEFASSLQIEGPDLKIVDFSRGLPPTKVPTPDTSNICNNTSLLLNYAKDMKWCIPEFVDMVRQPKGAPIQCSATVKLSDVDKKFTSFPHEVSTKLLARGYAAKHAIEWLLKEDEVKIDKKDVCIDNNLLFERINDIVCGYPAGFFAKGVEEEYIKKFREPLPMDWTEALRGCPTLSVEPSFNGLIIVPTLPVLEKVSSPPDLEPPPLDEHWSVFVTCAFATDSVWFRLIGEKFSDLYGELLVKMEEYYKDNELNERALRIVPGNYYAANTVNSVMRVCVQEVNEESQTVAVFLIDHGDVETLPFASMYRLLPEFCEVPKQAVRCILDGLEDLNQNTFAKEIVCLSLFGQTLIAEVTHLDQQTGCVKAVLHDTSKSEDLNMNAKLLDVILSEEIEPVMITEGLETEVYVGSVSKGGEVYVQIPSVELDWINQILEVLGTEEISKQKLTSFRQIKMNKIYLAKYSKDESFYRAVVKQATTNCYKQNKLAVQFIDFGNEDTVSISDIAAPDNLSPILSKIPARAIKVALHNLPIDTLTTLEIVKLKSLLMDEEKTLLMKTISSQENPPTVEIFYKTSSENSDLISINNTIAEDRILMRAQETNNPGSIEFPNGRPFEGLQQPILEKDFLPLVVVLAANPSNFIFQPVKYGDDLNNLMNELKAFYDTAALLELPKREIVKGQVYAAYYTDESWYRVVVDGEIMSSRVPVKFCDYGDVLVVPISCLRHLEPQFYEVPFLAVKGKLAGVSPAHMDWSVEDCVRFQDLVLNKYLASTITHIEGSLMDMVVTLNLVDTSTELDIVIANIFIQEKRAVKTSS